MHLTLFVEIFIDISSMQDLAIDSVSVISVDAGNGLREVDIKKYIKVEKIPGGQLEDSRVLKGVMFNKDVVSPGKMRRKTGKSRFGTAYSALAPSRTCLVHLLRVHSMSLLYVSGYISVSSPGQFQDFFSPVV